MPPPSLYNLWLSMEYIVMTCSKFASNKRLYFLKILRNQIVGEYNIPLAF